MDLRGVKAAAIGQLDANGPCFINDVKARGDQPVAGNDEARAHAVLLAVAPIMSDDNDGLPGRFAEGNGIWSFRSLKLFLGGLRGMRARSKEENCNSYGQLLSDAHWRILSISLSLTRFGSENRRYCIAKARGR